LTRIWRRLQRRTVAEIAPHLKLGQEGERLAERFLKKQGYRMVVTNLKVGLGRGITGRPLSGEIDIVAYDQATLCFIEVRREPRLTLPHPRQRSIAPSSVRSSGRGGATDRSCQSWTNLAGTT